jgi:fatty acid amide hydrolase
MSLHTLSARALQAELSTGQLSSEELVGALNARTAAVDPTIRAFVHRFDEAALTEARRLDEERRQGKVRGPLHGIPLSVKENIATAGQPQTLGIRSRLGTLAPEDAVVVKVLREAGAIVMGKTNVPLLLLSFETHNEIYGTTHNPWQLDRVPGGSSGGEAAAIASGQVPLGIGTDIGGSIRIPAAFCGLPGLKTTVGRWSVWGSGTGIPGQEIIRAVMGPMARTVDDLTLLMQVVSGEAQRRFDAQIPPVAPPDPAAVSLRGLRVGVFEDDGVINPVASVRRAVAQAAEVLREAGAIVVPFVPPNGAELVDLYFSALSSDGARTIFGGMGDQGPTPQLKTLAQLAQMPSPLRAIVAAVMRARGETRVSRQIEAFGEKRVAELWALTARRTALQRAELRAWEAAGIDVLIGPPSVTPAALHNETHDFSLGAWPTMRWNLLDFAAGVVPTGRVRPAEAEVSPSGDRLDRKAALFAQGSAGLPTGAQIIAAPWREDRVLAVMGAIEAALSGDPEYPTTPIDPPRR